MIQARTKPQRGVSLIEALVALAVMSIGMLGLVSLQTSLRGSSDVAKQRSVAVRLAQQEIERWRAFTVLDTTAGRTAYADLVEDTTPEDVTPLDTGTNATYTQVRIVSDLAAPQRGKSLTVNVSWTDRNNETQTVRLSTAVAGIAPELAATMTVPVSSQALQGPAGRHLAIPPMAKQLGNGRSGFIPPNAGPGVVWIFNNTTGLISLCTTTVTTTDALVYDGDDANAANNVSCGSAPSQAILISGFVRYEFGSMQPVATAASAAASAAAPSSKPLDAPASDLVQVWVDHQSVGPITPLQCNAEHVSVSTANPPIYYSAYYCAVPVTPNVTPSWSGSLFLRRPDAIAPLDRIATLLTDSSSALMKVCRYHFQKDYTSVAGPTANQNFLLIRAGNDTQAFTCPAPLTTPLCPNPLPSPWPPSPLPAFFTRPHQPACSPQ